MIKFCLIFSVFMNIAEFMYILKTEKALENCAVVLVEFVEYLGIAKATEIAQKALPGIRVDFIKKGDDYE